jgi:membrane-bound lytic murein transglycosylase D
MRFCSVVLAVSLAARAARAEEASHVELPEPPNPVVAADTPVPEPVPDAVPDAAADAATSELEALLASLRTDTTAPEPGRDTIASQTLPGLLSSAQPEPRPEIAEGRPDLAWLADLTLPDLPVRWDDRLVQQLEYYRNDPRGRANIEAWLKRAEPYRSMLRDKLRAAGQPEDLLYVAMVESGFDPTVRSEAGALGMWQFVKTTGQDYGLNVDRWVDLRMSPEHATDAAIAYLGELRVKLGSWPLALAAYNMGYGALQRAITKYNSNDFWTLSRLEAGLPYETVLYVHKIMACAVVGRNPTRFGLKERAEPPAPATRLVDVPGGVGLGRLARAAGMTTEQLAALNPELLKQRTPPDVLRWPLRLPADKLTRFSAKWPAEATASESHGRHVLRFGERLKDVAEQYETSAARLRALNGLADDTPVEHGFELWVPDVERIEKAPPSAPVVVGVPSELPSYPDRRRVFYRVAPQDQLGSIAAFFEVGLDELRRWNAVDERATLQPGMVLQLFVSPELDLSQALILTPDAVTTLVVGSDAFFDFHEAQRDRVRIRYRVRADDTLQALAERFELSIGSIARINGFSQYKKLEPGSQIILYAPKDSPAARQASVD